MPKTLMSYPRLSYGFSFILRLNEHFYSPISDLCNLCECRWNGQLLEAFWEQRVEVKRAGRNVVTPQRRDVGSTKIEVNKQQRRDISTSRRLNVAKLQHRDVSAIYASPSLKEKRGPEPDKGDTYEGGHGNQKSIDLDPEERTDFCIFFFSDKSIDVLYIKYLCTHIQYVLDLYLRCC